MGPRSSENFSYSIGIAASFVLHVLSAFLVMLSLHLSRANALGKQEVFSVTLEGGEKLGGISQVPSDEPGKKRPLPNVKTAGEEGKKEPDAPTEKTEKKLTEPSVVDDVVKKAEEQKLAEQKKLDEQKKLEQKKLEEQKKLDEQKKQEEERKKAEEEKKQAEEDKKREAQERKLRDKKLAQAIKNASRGGEGGSPGANLYKGESANAGGEGFGAAALGGKGMGGGTLASVEFIAYRNELERRIKAGWRWLPTPQVLTARVSVEIQQDGVVRDVRVIASSGNSNFDDSATRAVYKASPLPPPPATLYDKFREVLITFDSRES